MQQKQEVRTVDVPGWGNETHSRNKKTGCSIPDVQSVSLPDRFLSAHGEPNADGARPAHFAAWANAVFSPKVWLFQMRDSGFYQQ